MSLLEREAELTVLAGVLDRADDGHGATVLVRGDAGIGKTALLRHFVEASADKADVRWGSCDDLLTPKTFGPLWDVADSDDGLACALATNDRLAVSRSVMRFLGGGARPAVLVIDDAQWADEATLDLVTHIGHRIARHRGVLVVVSRDLGLWPHRLLVRVIGGLPQDSVVRLTVAPLSSAAVAEMAAARDTTADGVFERTGGNPLFVTELLDHPGLTVPDSVRDVTLSRMARLSVDAVDLLSLIAVVPGRMERSLVEACVGQSPAGLDECEEHGLIERTPTALSFTHELVRCAVEESLPAGRRRRLNQLVVDALDAAQADPARILHHARWARDIDAIVRLAPQAAAKAAAVDSHREAAEHYRQLEPYLDRLTVEGQARVLSGWARAEITLGEGARGLACATRAVAALRQLGDPRLLSSGLVQLSYACWFERDQAASEIAADEAVAVLETSVPPCRELARALGERATRALDAGQLEAAVGWTDRAIAVAEAARDPSGLAHALATRGLAIATARYPEGIDLLETSLDIARREHFGHLSLRTLVNLAEIALTNYDLERVDSAIVAGQTIARERARTSFEDDFRLLSAYHRFLVGLAGEVGAEIGDLADGDSFHAATATRLLGRSLSRRGHERATAVLSRARQLADREGHPRGVLLAAAAWTEHAWLVDASDIDAGAAAALMRDANSFGHPWIAGEIGLWLWKAAVLDEPPTVCADPFLLQMSGYWPAAADAWRRLGVPYLQAVALADGDRDAKVEALSILDRLESQPLAARIRTDLRAAGVVGVPRAPRAGVIANGGLTARQMEVLWLLRDGATNAQIAGRLFISARTAEHHVSAILRTLLASTRAEAVTTAERRGLFGELASTPVRTGTQA